MGGWGRISHCGKEGRRDAGEPFDQRGCVEGLGDVDTQKLDADDTLNLRSIYMDEGVCVCHHLTFCRPLWALWSSRCWEPSCFWRTTLLVFDLLPVGQLIVFADETNHCCVVCELDNGFITMCRCAVKGEEVVKEGAQHASLWNTSVQHNGWGGALI